MKVNSLSDSEQDKFLTNTYGIEKVQFSEDVQHFCPLGEQLGRKCFMMELDPHYVAVILKRWEDFTGQKAVKIKDV